MSISTEDSGDHHRGDGTWTEATHQDTMERIQVICTGVGLSVADLSAPRVIHPSEVAPLHDAVVTVNGVAYLRYPLTEDGEMTRETLAAFLKAEEKA